MPRRTCRLRDWLWCREVNFAACPITDGALWHLAHHSAEESMSEVQAEQSSPSSPGPSSPRKSVAGTAAKFTLSDRHNRIMACVPMCHVLRRAAAPVLAQAGTHSQQALQSKHTSTCPEQPASKPAYAWARKEIVSDPASRATKVSEEYNLGPARYFLLLQMLRGASAPPPGASSQALWQHSSRTGWRARSQSMPG